MNQRQIILAALALTYATIAGCKGKPDQTPTTRPAATQSWTVRPITVPGGPAVTPVKTGLAPVAYLVGSDAVLRIVEVDTGRVLLERAVEARTVVGIITEKGITLNGVVAVPGPLKISTRYAIYVVGDTTSESRSGMLRGEPTSRRSQD